MTRIELLRLLVGGARENGFQFRKWYVGKLGREWVSGEQAIEDLAQERRYYVLLFSHEFASNFWKAGETITFQVPQQTFKRQMADGTIGTVHRKAYTRRTAREDVWRYHLRELAVADEPLRYMRRYLRVPDELEPDLAEAPSGPRRPRRLRPSQAPRGTPLHLTSRTPSRNHYRSPSECLASSRCPALTHDQ